MIADLKVLFESLCRLKVGDFIHTRTLPPDAIASLDSLVRMFAAGDQGARREIADEVIPGCSFVFFLYARQNAVLAVRNNNTDILRRGLIALAIENGTFDWRDSLVVIAQVYHSARKFSQMHADKLLREVAEISLSQFRKLLLGFLSNSDTAKSIAAYRIRESIPPAAFDYEAVPAPPVQNRRTKLWGILRGIRRVLPIIR